MTRITYEIRTSRDAPVFSFDSLHRAKQELANAERRLKTRLRLVEVRQVERDIPA